MREPIPSTNLLKDIPDFVGFPTGSTKFLTGLAKNNEKVWFEKHRPDYEAHLLGPMRALVLAVGERLRPQLPRLIADPRVGGSVMRINRDTRFSTDKSPYKSWIACHWKDATGENGVGCYFHLDAKTAYAGGGIYQLDDAQLTRYRKALGDAKALRSLKSAISGFEEAGIEIGGETLKRPPRGFTPEHKAGKLMFHKGLYAGRDIPIGRARSVELVDDLMAVYSEIIPLLKWMTQRVVLSG